MNKVKTIVLKRKIEEGKAKEKLNKNFSEEKDFSLLVTEDCDAYSEDGELLFKFRKNAIPLDILKKGVESFEGSITKNGARGAASGLSTSRVRKDGSISNTTFGSIVTTGVVGYMDPAGLNRYCRKTAFSQKYFDKFKGGIPFVEYISEKYEELCPDKFEKQYEAANKTDDYYLIGDSVFSTVTVNENFRTAYHQDSGDFREGMGNLIVYREGSYKGGYFVFPEYGVALDLHNGDLLFADVHKFHGNSEITNKSEDWLRVSFVIYLREKIQSCSRPEEELKKVKNKFNGINMLKTWN